MSETNKVQFFNFFESKYPGLKRAKNKPYALMALKPESTIALVVKMNSVKVEFSSSGRAKSLSTDSLKKWAEDRGILNTEIAGQRLELADGVKNKDKLSVVINIPLDSEDELTEDTLQADVKAALDLIWNNLTGLAELPENISLADFELAQTQKGSLSSESCVQDPEDEDETAAAGLSSDDFSSRYLYLATISEFDAEVDGGSCVDILVSFIESLCRRLGRDFMQLGHGPHVSSTFYLIDCDKDQKRAIKLEVSDFTDSFKTDLDGHREKILSAINGKALPESFFFDDYNDQPCVVVGFKSSETSDGDLWSYEFSRIAQDIGSSVSICGFHSKYEDIAIQQWCDGEFDEGVESHPDEAAEFYVGTTTGESFKHEGRTDDDFILSNYEILSLSGESKVPSESQRRPLCDLDEVLSKLKEILNDIINTEAHSFRADSFKVRPEFGPCKFYLNRVDGLYGSSLQNLIHHILWEQSLYKIFLNERHLKEVQLAVETNPDGIYGTSSFDAISAEEEAEDERAQDLLNLIYLEAIQHVGHSLSQFSFFNHARFLEEAGLSDTE